MLSLRMQGENEVRRLYEETTGVPALEQKGLFNAELEGEMALEFMRTASPLTVIQNIVIPFMGCCCYLMDSCDEAIVRNESVKKEIASLKRIATQVSEEFEDNVINEERLDAFASQLRVTEEVVSKVGVLLRITEGDEKIVEALMAKALSMDVSGAYAENRADFVKLVEDRLRDSSADSSVYELVAESQRSDECEELDGLAMSVGHRLRIEKNEQRVVVSSALSACDLYNVWRVCWLKMYSNPHSPTTPQI